MAIFRGTGGVGNSTDDSIVSAVTQKAAEAEGFRDEAEGFRDEAEGFKNTASTSATTATTKASEASDSADTASDKATEANTAKDLAEDAQTAAEAARDTAQNHANTANNSSVQTVAGISTEVQNVNNIRTEIQNVDTIKTDVTTVAGISSNVTTVAADASDIGTVATNIANVNNVGDNIANVNAVHSNASNINTVAADGTDIGTVASNISDVNTVAGISSDVTTVAGLESKMDTVIADASDIGAVANNIGDVSTVAGINSEVDTVAGISAKVTTVADNISDVQSADTNAANASASASQAANSATAASNSANTASTKATEASNSATAASNSATTATTKATEAAGSATTATTKATEASTSATNAATSATTATTKASEAASSATAASGSATTATTKASEADASANSAASSATDSSNAASTWNDFYTTYLGAADAPPTADVQGNALQTGAFYYDTGAGSNTVGLYVYNGSSWVYSTNYNNVTAPYSLAQDLATNGNDISFGDNAKATFGASDDLQIYHNGSDSYIRDVGTGNLNIDATNFNLRTGGGNEIYLSATTNGAVGLRYDNAEKLATTSTGIDVTGDISLTSSTYKGLKIEQSNSNQVLYAAPVANTVGSYIQNNASYASSYQYTPEYTTSSGLEFDNNGDLYIRADSNLTVGTNFIPTNRVRVAPTGDISFYEDTGTTPKFFWDASAESLGLNTSSPSYPLTVYGSNPDSEIVASFGSQNDVNEYTAIGLSGFIAGNDATKAGIALKRVGVFGTGELHFLNNNTLNDSDMTLSDSKMMIDTSGKVGIGTTSPAKTLHISDGTNDTPTTFRIENTDTNIETAQEVNSIEFYTNDVSASGTGITAKIAQVAENPGNQYGLAFSTYDVGLAEVMRIDESGKVGIGTTSPSRKLQVSTSGTGIIGTFGRTDASSAYITFTGSTTTSDSYVGAGATGNNFFVRAGNAERMRIDSSGNVVVGKTTTGVTVAGIEARADGLFVATRDGGNVGLFNRKTSDGDVVQFRKDNTTVGSIGTRASYLNVGSGDTGLLFNSGQDRIQPESTTGGARDAAIDLGGSTTRFKDLHLSGTGYFGTKVGIGTTSPAEELHISAAIPKVRLQDSDGTNQYGEFFHSNGTTALLSRNNTGDGTIVFQKYDGTTVDETMRIDSSGNVLVGKTSSSFNTAGVEFASSGRSRFTRDSANVIEVNRTTNDGSLVTFNKDGTSVGSIGTKDGDIYLGTGDTGLRFYDDGDSIYPVNSSTGSGRDAAVDLGRADGTTFRFKDLHLSGTGYFGTNVGIGTTNLTRKFRVVDATDASVDFRTTDGTDRSFEIDVTSSASEVTIGTATNHALAVKTNDTERMRVDTSGNLLVGQTSTANYETAAGHHFRPNGFVTHTRDSGTIMVMNRLTNDGPTIDFRRDNTTVGTISVTSSATAYNTSSDERLKENIQDAEDAGSKIDAIQVRQFDWKSDGSHQDYGVIAQELLEVAPEAVTEGETEDDMMSVDYSKLVPTLIKEIQTLRNRVAQLENN